MKLILFLAVLMLTVLLTACKTRETTSNVTSINTILQLPITEPPSSAQCINIFKAAGLPLTNIIYTDPTITKFDDTRILLDNRKAVPSCFLKICNSQKEATQKIEELAAFTDYKDGHLFQNDSMILFLPSTLSTNQVDQYKKIFLTFSYTSSLTKEEEKTKAPALSSSPDSKQATTYKIGHDLAAGEYVLFSNGSSNYYEITDRKHSSDNPIVHNYISTNVIVSIKKGEYLTLKQAYAVPIEQAPQLDTSKQGTFKVGLHLKAGDYKIALNEKSPLGFGYVEITKDATHFESSLITSNIFTATNTIHLSDGEYVYLSGAHIVK